MARCAFGLIALVHAGAAQSADVAGGPSQPVVPTFQSMAHAARTQSATLTQVRRFREGTHIVSVREQMQIVANGTLDPTCVLTFVGVEGEAPGSTRWLQWQDTYSRYASLFCSQGSFRVRDDARVNANYSIHDFGPITRAGRAARRMVVFPNTLDKAMWVVDVDNLTGLVFYAAEFDAQLHLLAEVETLSHSTIVAQLAVAQSSGVKVRDLNAARYLMGQPAELVDPNVSIVSEYALDGVEVHNDPLNGQWKVTMTYTDGIDQFLVVQAPGTRDYLGTLPVKAQGGNVIGRYRDPAMSVLVFWESGVSFHVAGRGSLRRLDTLAQRVYLQALTTH